MFAIETAVSWCEAGDDGRARHHLEVAQNFHGGGLEEEFKEARRAMREIREAHRKEQSEKLAEREARIDAMEDSPFHARNDLSPILQELNLEGADAAESVRRRKRDMAKAHREREDEEAVGNAVLSGAYFASLGVGGA